MVEEVVRRAVDLCSLLTETRVQAAKIGFFGLFT